MTSDLGFLLSQPTPQETPECFGFPDGIPFLTAVDLFL